ncbi:MAG TPA: hybrid sensor histidine kinase/response regulator, partial [Polyangiales bacterium]
MDRDKLIQRLRGTFVAELQEHVGVFNRELLALEQHPNAPSAAESIRSLFRSAHSLKGASRSVNATRLEGVCHQLEELLAGLRDGTRALTPEIIAQLFAAVDTFEEVGREFAAEQPPPSAAAASKPNSPAPHAAGPASPPLQPSAPRVNVPNPAPQVGAATRAGGSSSRSVPPPSAAASSTAATLSAGAAAFDLAVPTPQPLAVALTEELLPPPSAAREPANQNVSSDAMIRVPGRKLDTLLSQSGELLIARRRFDGRRSELAALQEQVAAMRTKWRGLDPLMRQWSTAQAKKEPKASSSPEPAVAGVGAVSRKALHVLTSTRDQLDRLERSLDSVFAGISDDMRQLDRAASQLEEQIHQARMLPFSQACEGLYRSARDLARDQDKDIELSVEGGDTELDRSIIDTLRDPLLHIVRNAIDHGIESTLQRTAAGKALRASVRITVNIRAEQVEITIADDGRGIDYQRLKAAAARRNLDVASEGEAELLRLIFEPGFSTASTVTRVSGRGVGLDVVKSQIESMRGSVEVWSQVGEGTRFTLRLPLTVTTLRVLFVRVASEVFAFPSSSVQRLIRAAGSDLGVIEGREMLLTESGPIPIVSLAELLGSAASAPAQTQSKLPLIVTRQQNQTVALAVDELLSEQDVVCKPLGARVHRLRNISAATVLPTGRVALLLKPSDLVQLGVSRAPARRISGNMNGASKAAPRRVLLVDDSATTRTLERSILEAAGYDVMAAVDGAQAW